MDEDMKTAPSGLVDGVARAIDELIVEYQPTSDAKAVARAAIEECALFSERRPEGVTGKSIAKAMRAEVAALSSSELASGPNHTIQEQPLITAA